jgi:hypothetical protein
MWNSRLSFCNNVELSNHLRFKYETEEVLVHLKEYGTRKPRCLWIELQQPKLMQQQIPEFIPLKDKKETLEGVKTMWQ